MSKSSSGGGIGVLTVVGIVFVILKLVGVIDWSWWWVLAPFWIGILFWIFIFIALIIAFIAYGGYEQYKLEKQIQRNKNKR